MTICPGLKRGPFFGSSVMSALVQLNRQKNVDSKIIPVKTITYVNYHAFPKGAVTY